MSRILVSLPEKFLQAIDALAESEHRSRSELIREAMRAYIRKATRTSTNDEDIANELKELT